MNAELQNQLESADKSIDLVLKILGSSGPIHTLDLDNQATTARHRLLDLLAIALNAVERHLSADTSELPDGLVATQPASLFSIVLKLIRFTLGLGRTEANLLTTPRADFGRLSMSFLRVLTVSKLSAMTLTIDGTHHGRPSRYACLHCRL